VVQRSFHCDCRYRFFTPAAGLIFDPERAKRSVDALGFTVLGSIVVALILFGIGKTFLNRVEDTE
jgi:hypothetical protein